MTVTVVTGLFAANHRCRWRPIKMEALVDPLFNPEYHPDHNDHPFFHPHDLHPQNHNLQLHPTSPIDEEPLYVNAKQYFRILKRRVARARLEEVHRLSRQRKVHFSLPFLLALTIHHSSPIFTSPAINMPCVVPAVLAVVFSPPKK